MNSAWTSPEGWLLHAALASGLVMWLTWRLVCHTHGPARQQRLAEVGVAAALLAAVLAVGPAWLTLSVPVVWTAAESTAVAEAVPAPPEAVAPEVPSPEFALHLPAPHSAEPAAPEVTSAPSPLWTLPEPGVMLAFAGRGVVVGYAVVAGILLLRWLFAWLALARLVATAEAPSEEAARLFDSMQPGGMRARLLVSRSLCVPVGFGMFWPTVMIPRGLSDVKELRWVFAHELAHLRRGDAWTSVLFAVGEVVFFYLPWFWLLRRQVRLCQEYLADAAVAEGEAHPEEYAEFLLSLAPAPVPAGAASMSGSSSDLYRRITRMLTERTSNEKSNRPWGWGVVVCGLLAVAVVASGVGLNGTRTVADEPKKEEPKQEAPKQEKKEEKKEEKKPKEPRFVDPFEGVGPNLDELFKKLGEGDEQGLAEFQKEMQKTLEELRKAMGPRGRVPGAMPLPGLPGVPFAQPAVQGQGRLGVRVEKPSETLVEQLDLPKDQGLVVREVVADSAAAKAGLKEHDILLEVAGKPVSRDPSGLAKMIEGVKADEKFDAVVLRKGRRETVKGVTLPEPKTAKKPTAKNPFDGFGGKGNAVSTSLTRNGDEFTLQEKKGDVTLTLTGTVEAGKAKLGSVTVKEGDSSKDYDSLEKVPEAHRERVQQLLEMAGKGGVKVEVRN